MSSTMAISAGPAQATGRSPQPPPERPRPGRSAAGTHPNGNAVIACAAQTWLGFPWGCRPQVNSSRCPEALAEVPFVDALTTMLDDTLPLTPPEWPEWGNPIADKAAYETILAYSPYDQVEAKAYPHILAVAGLTDPRVTYWEPAKWVAKLRDRKTDSNLLLLKTNMGAGHGGASGRFDRLKEVAFVYAFGLKVAERAGAG